MRWEDQDCDGQIDESFESGPVLCGVGACERDGVSLCVDGQIEAECRPGIAGSSDDTCDGVDQDCDGKIDEGCPERPDDAFLPSGNDAGIAGDAGNVSSDMEGVVSDGGQNLADGSLGFYCNDGSICLDGAFEPGCELDGGCDASIIDPDELNKPIDNGCNCVQGSNSPFTWAGILVCLLLGLSRRRQMG